MGFHPINLLSFNATYLAEMVPVENQCCLRSQLEKMELCSENLLSSGNRRQVEPVLHLFTAHCNEILSLESRKAQRHLISYSSQEQTGARTRADLTFVKETAHSIPLQKVRVLGHTVHVSNCVVQIKHVLRWLLVSMDSWGVFHPKNLQKSLDGR